MKISVDSVLLQKGLNIVGRAVTSRNIVHILGGILLETHNEGIRLTATNLELGVEYNVAADIEEDGSIVLPASILIDIVRKSNTERLAINVDVEKNRGAIKGANFNMELAGFSSADYPEAPVVEGDKKIILQAGDLHNTLEQVLYALATDDIRPLFTGVLFDFKHQSITCSATDGFRIASSCMATEHQGYTTQAVVPGKNCHEVIRLLSILKPDEIEVYIAQNQLGFKFAGVTVITKLLEGKYPQVDSFVPKKFHTRLLVEKTLFSECLDRAGLILRNMQHGVVRLVYNENEVTIIAKSTDLGHYKEKLPVKGNGNNLEVLFTLKYLQDLIKHIDHDLCELNFAEKYNLLVAKPENNEHIYGLLMPVTSEV